MVDTREIWQAPLLKEIAELERKNAELVEQSLRDEPELVSGVEHRLNVKLAELEAERDDATKWRGLSGCNSFEEMHATIGLLADTQAKVAELEATAQRRLELLREALECWDPMQKVASREKVEAEVKREG